MDLISLDKAFYPLHEGVIILDSATYTILSINPKLESILGYSRSEVIGKELDFLFPEDKKIFKIIDILTSKNNPKKILWQLSTKLGNVIEIEFTFQILNFNEDNNAYLIFYIQDISELASISQKIDFSQNLYRAIREIKTLLFTSNSYEDIFQSVCESLQKARGFDLVWGIRLEEGRKLPSFSDRKNSNGEYISKIQKILESSTEPIPILEVINDAQNLIQFFEKDNRDRYSEWYKIFLPHQNIYSLCLQISWDDKIYGAIELMHFSQFPITEDDIRVFQEFGADIGFTFYSKKTEEIKTQAIKKIEYQGILLDTIEVPILSINREGMVQYSNSTAENILKYSFNEMEGRTVRDFLGLTNSTLDFIQSRSTRRELIIQNDRIPLFPALLHSSPIRGLSGDFHGVMIVIFDLTEQKNQEQIIRESESKLRNIFSGLNNGVVIVDQNGGILDVAPVLKFHLFQFLNIEKQEKIFEFLDHSQAANLQLLIHRCIENWKVEIAEFSYNFLGMEKFFSVRFLPVKKYSQVDQAVMLVFTDITQTKNLNHMLIESAKFASIGELSAGIAHEINNPLQSALLYLEDLLQSEEEDPNERKKILETIESAILRIKALVENLLDLGRTQSTEKVKSSPEWIMFRALDLMDANLRKKGIKLEKRIDADLPFIIVRWQEIEQVIINCIMNSINSISEMEHPPVNPTIKVSLSSERFVDKDWVEYTIEDNGSGMPKEIQDKAFLPLFTTRRNKQGTGLGLSISKKIITDHEGEIEFINHGGDGSKISILLPAFYPQEN
ncbi:PAS domain S-box protein [Leptospira sp. GIMC2001]|uniref:PAS domain S-box protein n=1 Tax=Leptospira sp. GIMC2001 TaxID=1513297 RepID=UPI00234B6457|nr:PAS domain S-box protein [Leptospira sp. GIMC2001]WCL49822.1 PAS domain S-box protein [Leptospira sp. GIMC2001]